MKPFWTNSNIFAFLFLFTQLPCCMSSTNTVNESISKIDMNLRKKLLSSFSPNTRPILNNKEPVELKIGIEIRQLISVDERSQQIHVKLWTRMTWINEFISWDPKEWGGIENLKVDPSSIWTPDISLYNDIHEHQDAGYKKYKKRITIYANGSNHWNSPAVFASTCKIDVKYFPFDVQTCVLTFGSWEHPVDELQLDSLDVPVVTYNYQNSSEWDLVAVNVSVNTVKYECCDTPYQDITFKFIIHRRPLYYIFNVILPCIILMVIVLFSFFLPPDSGERIAIVITVLLAFTVFLQMMNKSLPRNSDTAPVLSVFYITIMSESTFSLITTCIVLIAHHKGKEKWTRPLPGWIKSLIFDKISKNLGLFRSNTYEEHSESFKNITRREHHHKHFNNNSIRSKEDSSINNHHQRNHESPHKSTTVNDYLEKLLPSNHHNHHSEHLLRNDKLDSILNELHEITTIVHEHRVRDKNELEWRYFSNVLDRMFFLMFVVVFVVSSLTILLPAYYSHEREAHNP